MKRKKYWSGKGTGGSLHLLRVEGRGSEWILYNELRYRFEHVKESMMHYLLFETEAIPAKVLKMEWNQQNRSSIYKIFDV